MVTKRIIEYRNDLNHYIKLGGIALVNIPDKNGVAAKALTTTSKVIIFDPPSGEFETLDAIYRPYKGD